MNVARTCYSPWSHWLAWGLAVTVFALICMGGTVTTYEAGMAVPDWPTTYDYWFYPLAMWLAVWDVFLEHGHRLLGQLAGILAIASAILLWRKDDRKWMRWVAIALVLGVVFQGTLGGLRVLIDNRLLARIHGCAAPLYLGLCTMVLVWTSRLWREATPEPTDMESARRARWRRLAWLLTAALYLEIVFGAQLRRPSSDTVFGSADLWVWLKVINGGLIVFAAAWLLAGVWAGARNLGPAKLRREIVRKAFFLGCTLFVQFALAGAAWIANYGWPDWLTHWVEPFAYTVTAQGRLQVIATTAHAAVGSLALAASLNLAMWLQRGAPAADSRQATAATGAPMGSVS